MRIADVCGFYSPNGGGVRRYVDQKLEAAARLGHDLTVIAPGVETRTEERPGGRIAWLQSPPMPFDPAYRRFAAAGPIQRALDAAAPDVVEASSPWLSGWAVAGWRGRAARAFVFHQDVVAAYCHTLMDRLAEPAVIDRLFWPYWRRLRRLSSHFDVTVTASEWLARRLARLGLHRPRSAPFGIEAGLFSPALRDEALRRDLLARCGAPEGGRLVLAVGRFHPEKRHRTILSGFALARARAPWPMGLVLVGDGLIRRQVEAQARRIGGVWLAGAVEDRAELARLYASADVLAHGSAAETYGLVVAEALASGLPAAVPSAGGAADLAALGPARLYRPGDASGLAEALLALLTSPPEPAGTQPPTVDRHFTELFDLYRSLADGKSLCGARAKA